MRLGVLATLPHGVHGTEPMAWLQVGQVALDASEAAAVPALKRQVWQHSIESTANSRFKSPAR